MDPNPVEVGQRIKKIRIEKGLSQKEFAKKINSTIPAISNWENGRNLPNKERLKTIAGLADISVDELLYGTNKEIIKKAIEDAFSERVTKGSSYFMDYESDPERYQNLIDNLYLRLATNDLYTKYSDNPYSIVKKIGKDEIFREHEKGERTTEKLKHYLSTLLRTALYEIDSYRDDEITKKAITEGNLTESDLEILSEVENKLIKILEQLYPD